MEHMIKMAVNFIYVSYLFLGFVPIIYCGVPVLIWESSSTNFEGEPISALSQLDSDEFSNYIVKRVHANKPLIALFLEETLSVEDFSWRDDSHKGSFPQVQNITSTAANMEFVPSVEDPVSALKSLAETHNFQWKKYDSSKLPNKKGTVLEVKLKDPKIDEDRPELLSRHDGNIAEIYSSLLAEESRVLAIMTGKMSAWVEPDFNRVRREAEANETATSPEPTSEKSLEFDIKNDKLLMHSSKLPRRVEGQETLIVTNYEPFSADVRDNYMRMPVKLFSDKSAVTVRFRFDDKGDEGWELSEVQYVKDGEEEAPLKPSQPIGAPKGKSFHTNSLVEFKNDKSKLSFDNLQVEPWPRMLGSFSQPVDKEQFFTATIWSGIFVTFILALIFIWGITMLLDVRTMDRFDDPKGKTISVNVNE